MTVEPTPLSGLRLIRPDVFRDERGFFLETFNAQRYAEHGIGDAFVQDNHSYSTRGTLRGLHLQVAPAAQSKLVRVVSGSIFDVAVDVRRGSPTFGRWHGVELRGDNHHQLFIPIGFAHGFYVVSESAHVEYKCSTPYAPEHQIAIAWNDPELVVAWPEGPRTLSKRDAKARSLSACLDELPSL